MFGILELVVLGGAALLFGGEKLLEEGSKMLDRAIEADLEKDRRDYAKLSEGIDDIFKDLE